MHFPRFLLSFMVIGLVLSPAPQPVFAEPDSSVTQTQTVYHADLVSSLNPDGIMLFTGVYRRWSGPALAEYGMPGFYTQAGIQLGANPAYLQAGLYGEWMPALFAKIRLQYDYFHFNGTNGSLLSFSSAGADFGDQARDALAGRAETGWAQRLLLQPEFRAKIGRLIVRNTADLAYYRFDGNGPYFLEQEYDTLLEEHDYLLNNRTALLLEARPGAGSGSLLAGPFYEITHTVYSDLTRQRAGAQMLWMPDKAFGRFSGFRLYAQIGQNLQDQNRDGELFFMLGLGFDLNLSK